MNRDFDFLTEIVESVEEFDVLTKPIDNYTTTEFLLLCIFVILCIGLVIKIVKK